MPKVIFKVLCAANEDSCERVRGLMKDFILEPYREHGFEYIWKKNFGTVLEADREKNKISDLAGDDLADIKLALEP